LSLMSVSSEFVGRNNGYCRSTALAIALQRRQTC
jgi:hypothetical protein